MAEIKAPLPESPPPRRPWYRLHLSTWIVFFFTVGILILLIVPGEPQISVLKKFFPSDANKSWHRCLQHGWPWNYLERYFDSKSTPSDIDLDEYHPPWLCSYNWRFDGDKMSFSPLFLLLDIIASATILFLAAFGVEWRRRRGLRVWQFTLYEMLLMMLFLAGVLAWWRTNHMRTQRENDFIESEFGGTPFLHYKDYCGPLFLKKLLGTQYLNDYFTVTLYWLDNKNDRFKKANLSFSTQLANIEIIYCEKASHADIKEISELRHLKVLRLYDSTLSDEDYTYISQISSLEALSLRATAITPKALLILGSLSRLKGLGLNETGIGDESARALASLDNLQYLYIRNSYISDYSVSYLGNLTRLRELHIQDTDITPHGYKRLRILLPHCKIFYDTGDIPEIPSPRGTGMF